jgi:ribosome-associated translation inhibitor RaiA/cold shock CspA family protein
MRPGEVPNHLEILMESPLQITFKDMESSEFLERLVRERVAKLERFHPNLIHCRVVLEVPHRSPESGKTPLGVTVEVSVSGHPMIVAKGEEERREMKGDHTSVLNRVFDSVQRQLGSISDVQKGQVKQHESTGETGQIVRLFPLEDYGFIEVRGSPDLYFTRNAVVGGDFDALEPGTMVQITRATTEGPMGPQASSVRVLSAPHSPP